MISVRPSDFNAAERTTRDEMISRQHPARETLKVEHVTAAQLNRTIDRVAGYLGVISVTVLVDSVFVFRESRRDIEDRDSAEELERNDVFTDLYVEGYHRHIGVAMKTDIMEGLLRR